MLFTLFAASVEHQPAHRVGRIAAIGQQILYGCEMGDGLVLAESDQQIGQRLLGNAAGTDRLGQRNKNRMAGAALIAGIEFPAPQVEQGKRLCRIAYLVSEIVGDAAIGVEAVKVGAQSLGKKPGADVEILVVRLG